MPRGTARSTESLPKQVAGYVPVLPDARWQQIGPFVRAAVLDAVEQTPYSVPDLMFTVTHHVDWCRFTAGLELERAIIFDRRVIAHAVGQHDSLSPASRSNARAQLLRVAEALLPTESPLRLPVLPAAEPSAPYADVELNSFRSWAQGQPTLRARLSASALLALGAGAGLAARELAATTPADVTSDADGILVTVRGARPRTVPVLRSWEELLLMVVEHTAASVPLFRPGHKAFYPNIVTNFVTRSAGAELKPQSLRLRATWIVILLASGAPPRSLMAAAGVSSLEALTRYLRFVPDADPETARFALRYAELRL